MAKRENIVVGLDIGTTKICVIVGEATKDGIEVVGVGTHPSRGLRKGVVVNIDTTVESIKKAVEEAELMAGCEINRVYTGISGGHIKTFNSHGVIAVKDGEITKADVDRVIEAAQAIPIPPDREIIHGIRLEVKVHIVTAAMTSAQNIVKCANKAGLDVVDIALQQLVSSEAVLTQDERELGVALLDIGGGTTDIAVFHGGNIKYTTVLSIGGNQVTGDLAVGLRTPSSEAEKIKKKHGCAMASMINQDETVEAPGVGGYKPRKVSRHLLGEIIEPRMEEIFELIRRELVKSGYEGLISSGVGITGGAAAMEGVVELAEQVFDLPARRGIPMNVSGLVDIVQSPAYSTGLGLVRYGIKHSHETRFARGGNNLVVKIAARMKDWFKEFF